MRTQSGHRTCSTQGVTPLRKVAITVVLVGIVLAVGVDRSLAAKRQPWVVLTTNVTTGTGEVKHLRLGRTYTYNILMSPFGHPRQISPPPGDRLRVVFEFQGIRGWSRLGGWGGLLGFNYCNTYRAHRVRLSNGHMAIDFGPRCETFSLVFRPWKPGRHTFSVRTYIVGVHTRPYRIRAIPRGGAVRWRGLITP
jgi:hypothetical protein